MNRASCDCFVLQRPIARVQSPFRPLLTRLRLFHSRILPLAIVHHSMRANCRYPARSSTGGHLAHFHAVCALATLFRLRPFSRRSNIYNYREGLQGARAHVPLISLRRLFRSDRECGGATGSRLFRSRPQRVARVPDKLTGPGVTCGHRSTIDGRPDC